jgi:hypothetical protein
MKLLSFMFYLDLSFMLLFLVVYVLWQVAR